jgi:hypothetical protein
MQDRPPKYLVHRHRHAIILQSIIRCPGEVGLFDLLGLNNVYFLIRQRHAVIFILVNIEPGCLKYAYLPYHGRGIFGS